MVKEAFEKKKINPLVYFIGIPVGILILVIAYNIWVTDSVRRACASNIEFLGRKYDPVSLSHIPNCLEVLGNR